MTGDQGLRRESKYTERKSSAIRAQAEDLTQRDPMHAIPKKQATRETEILNESAVVDRDTVKKNNSSNC